MEHVFTGLPYNEQWEEADDIHQKLFLRIISFLPLNKMMNLCYVCREWYVLIQGGSCEFWKDLIERDLECEEKKIFYDAHTRIGFDLENITENLTYKHIYNLKRLNSLRCDLVKCNSTHKFGEYCINDPDISPEQMWLVGLGIRRKIQLSALGLARIIFEDSIKIYEIQHYTKQFFRELRDTIAINRLNSPRKLMKREITGK